jgi:hypothetical protein
MDFEIFEGLVDLKQSEERIIEDFCDEIEPVAFKFYPEAYPEEQWAEERSRTLTSVDELREVAVKVSHVRQSLMQRAFDLEKE